jgi:hypothetical protein
MARTDLIDLWVDLGKGALSPSAAQRSRLLVFTGRPASSEAPARSGGETAACSDLQRSTGTGTLD